MTVVCDDVVNVENGFMTPDMFKHFNAFKSAGSIILTILPQIENSSYIFINRLRAGNAKHTIIKMLNVTGYFK